MAGVRLFRWYFEWPKPTWKIAATVDAADIIPEKLPANGVVIVGTRSRPKWIAFDCPCRRGHRILLNADRARAPSWRISVRGRVSITPSVDADFEGMRCHYFVAKGKTMWVGANGPSPIFKSRRVDSWDRPE